MDILVTICNLWPKISLQFSNWKWNSFDFDWNDLTKNVYYPSKQVSKLVKVTKNDNNYLFNLYFSIFFTLNSSITFWSMSFLRSLKNLESAQKCYKNQKRVLVCDVKITPKMTIHIPVWRSNDTPEGITKEWCQYN